jgi:hypothetical protein
MPRQVNRDALARLRASFAISLHRHNGENGTELAAALSLDDLQVLSDALDTGTTEAEPSDGPTNAERADRGGRVMGHYLALSNSDPTTDPEDLLADLITDIVHWLRSIGSNHPVATTVACARDATHRYYKDTAK